MTREAKIEEEFYRLTKNVLEKRDYEVDGVKFGDPEPQHKVDSGVADLMVPLRVRKPLFITEFKRKIQTPKGPKLVRDTDPLGSKVITQALAYAVQCGAPFFSTTNGRVFALFTTPDRGEPFRMDRHRLLVKEMQLSEDVIEEILLTVARYYQGEKVERTALDWTFIIRLRSFVEWLSSQILPLVQERLKVDVRFKEEYAAFSQEVNELTPEAYAREAAYILMNKLVFYKILERYYSSLPPMKPIVPTNGSEFSSELAVYFGRAMEITNDFEPVFSAGFHDEAPLPDDPDMLEEINAFIDDMETHRLEKVGSDVVGFIYERLIPEKERHQLGQFYTPPQVAEVITRWAIREPTDKVMDPACGSGTFLVKAYGRLKELKQLPPDTAHKEILKQIYAVDINPFPAHLTAMNLCMRDVRHPTSQMNIVVEDFFKTAPRQRVFAPYTIKTPKGESRREILVPLLDAIAANPPYTRWTELPDATRKAIDRTIGSMIRTYKMTAGMVRSEPMIYVHFVMHSSGFLKDGGRLGMIISNSWLQTDYGIKFGAFMLDNFRVKAVIDFAPRLFSIPLVATTVILLEKESSQENRDNNQIAFLYVDKPVDVTEILDAVYERGGKAPRVWRNLVPQGELPRDMKWIGAFFGGYRCEKLIRSSKYVTSLGDVFTPLRGNTDWAKWAVEHGSRLDLGANEFFYLDKATVEQWGLQEYVVPALVSARYSKNFCFHESDWKELRDRNAKAFLFAPRKSLKALPERVRGYIEWGEKECKTRDGEPARSSQSCKRRAGQKRFKGWYDIGGVIPSPIFGTYYVQYRHRFGLASFPVALDTGILAYIPRRDMTQDELKATAAYLNSTFFQLMVETNGVSTGGGMIELEMSQAEKLPVVDAGRMPSGATKELSRLFDELETESRKAGGAHKEDNLQKLAPVFEKIDVSIAKLLRLRPDVAEHAKEMADLMRKRRIARAKQPKPETIRGREVPGIRPPRKAKRVASESKAQSLEKWIHG